MYFLLYKSKTAKDKRRCTSSHFYIIHDMSIAPPCSGLIERFLAQPHANEPATWRKTLHVAGQAHASCLNAKSDGENLKARVRVTAWNNINTGFPSTAPQNLDHVHLHSFSYSGAAWYGIASFHQHKAILIHDRLANA